MDKQDVIDNLSETVGEKKAADLVDEAIDEAGVAGQAFDDQTAEVVLTTITEMDDVSSLATVAANTTLAQLR